MIAAHHLLNHRSCQKARLEIQVSFAYLSKRPSGTSVGNASFHHPQVNAQLRMRLNECIESCWLVVTNLLPSHYSRVCCASHSVSRAYKDTSTGALRQITHPFYTSHIGVMTGLADFLASQIPSKEQRFSMVRRGCNDCRVEFRLGCYLQSSGSLPCHHVLG